MDGGENHVEALQDAQPNALLDFVRLVRMITGASAARLEVEDSATTEGIPSGSPTELRLGTDDRLLIFGTRIDQEALAPLLRRIVAHLESRRAERESGERHALALATAERANEIARSAARRFEALFEGLPVACYACDSAGRLVEWNHAAEEIWGAAIAMGWGHDVAAVVDPDHPEAERALLSQALAGQTVRLEEREVRIGGDDRRWHLVSMFPLRDASDAVVGAIGARLDITRRRTAQRELAEREARFRTVLQALHEGLIVVDATGRAVLRNPSAGRILRLREDTVELGGDFPVETVIDAEGRPVAPGEWPLNIALRTGRPARGVLLGLIRPGVPDRIWISVNAEALLQPGSEAPIGAVATFTDVTARVEHDHRLAACEARLAEYDAA